MHLHKTSLAIAVGITLSACGGGGGGALKPSETNTVKPNGAEVKISPASVPTAKPVEVLPAPEPAVEASTTAEVVVVPEPVVTVVVVPEPVAAAPKSEPVVEVAAKPEPEPEPVVEVAAEPEPEPVVEVAAEPEPEPEPVVEVVEAAAAPVVHFIRIGEVKPLTGSGTVSTETALIAQDLDRTGGDELIMVGRQNPNGATADSWQNFNLTIWGWSDGSLVDKTNQWFGAIDRSVTGVEEEVKFGDFDGDGHLDMYAGPYTDDISLRAGYELSSTGAVFFNSGASSFDQRVDIVLEPDSHAHASAVADLDGDGTHDIWSTAGGTSTVLLGNAQRNFTRLPVAGNPQAGGAAVAIADFTAVGTKGVILADQGSARATTGSINNLYSYNIDLQNNRVDVTHVTALPTPRFELSRWTGQGFTGGHEIRVLADIQLSEGKTASSQNVVSDAVIISRANQYDPGHAQEGQWPELSEIQFLLNDGSGTFTDVTDTVLKDYDTATVASYNASVRDVNGDDRLDIIVPGNSWTSHAGSQILIWQSASNSYGFEYQSSYATVLEAFQDGAKALENNASFTANGVALIQDPSGTLFVATAIGTDPGNTGHATHRAVYITPLNTITYDQTRAVIQANWSWLTEAQVDSIMAQSTRTYLGLNLLDPTLALSPIGSLMIPTANGLKPLTGSVSGLQFGDAISALRVQDSAGRDFEMDYSSTQINSLSSWSNRLDENNDSTRIMSMVDSLRFGESHGFRYGASDDNRTKVFGMPNYPISERVSLSWQFTELDRSPWMTLSGSWGTIKSTNTVEASLSWTHTGWQARAGALRTNTEIDPGLVTRITPITAVWADVGMRRNNWTVNAGVLPKIMQGSAQLHLPTGVDNQGRIKYTDMTVGFDNPLLAFARIGYQTDLSGNAKITVNGMASSNGAFVAKAQIKSTW